MFRHTPRAMAADIADIEQRMLVLEKQISRYGATARNGVSQATDRIGDVVASALADVADRFRGLRGNARTVSDEAARFGHEAARMGQEAARMGNNALWRVAAEVEHRPLMLLAVAAGVGLLIGMAGRRH